MVVQDGKLSDSSFHNKKYCTYTFNGFVACSDINHSVRFSFILQDEVVDFRINYSTHNVNKTKYDLNKNRFVNIRKVKVKNAYMKPNVI